MTADRAAAVDSWLAAHAAGTPTRRVLMDLHLPGLDRLEAVRRIRAIEAEQEARAHRSLAHRQRVGRGSCGLLGRGAWMSSDQAARPRAARRRALGDDQPALAA